MPGRLYDFGRYPGARHVDQLDEWVIGEVFRLAECGLLATLDEYEGPEYERAMVSASLEDRRSIECWIYWYVSATPGRPIASGDWFQR